MKALQKKTKILYLVNQFSMHGGIQRTLSHKIDAWVEEYGYEVVVVTINQSNAPVVYPPKNDFKLVDLKIQRKKKRYSVYELFTLTTKVNKILKNETPNIVITTLTGIPSLLLPFILPKINKVLEIHSSGALSVSRSWKYKWPFLNRYHKVVLLNEDEKKYYQLSNMAVIPNFIQIDSGDQIVYRFREKKIIAAGRVHLDKQYDHLIKIWEKISKKHPDWEVEIYGDGEEDLLKEYRAYINQNNIERITFLPATSNLKAIMVMSSILCLTSQTESFGMVLLECKCAALPAVSYDSPNGPRHIISDDGLLIERNNIEKFAFELSDLIRDEEKRVKLSEKAFQNRHKFSAKEVIKKWNDLL